MKFTDAARTLLKRLEGCRLQSYQDEGGVWTIGYGHTGRDVCQGLAWTQAQAEAALDRDLDRFIIGVGELVKTAPIPLTSGQFSALVIFTYNVGIVAFMGSTALRDILSGQLSNVPAQLARWDKVRDRSGVPIVSSGLVHRRQAEVDLWRAPDRPVTDVA